MSRPAPSAANRALGTGKLELSDFFIRRPVFAIVINVITFVALAAATFLVVRGCQP